jgi:PEP-CTERM motif-containing protein
MDSTPGDTTAFITGLTFESDGMFTGTQTPITEAVAAAPEPSSAALFASGLLGLRLLRRRRRPNCACPQWVDGGLSAISSGTIGGWKPAMSA